MPPRKRQPPPDTISDPIDWVSHFWEQYGIEGNGQNFVIASSLLRYHRLVVYAMEAQLRPLDLNTTDYLLLMTLQLSKSGTRLISSLARHLMIHATTATLATDRLENRKLLYRSPHPSDRRATCVTISDEGRELLHKATVALDAVDFGLVGTTPATLRSLASVLSTLRKASGDTERF